jgi:hypothetical protein
MLLNLLFTIMSSEVLARQLDEPKGLKQNRIFTSLRNGSLILPSGDGQTIVLERLRRSLFSSGRLWCVLLVLTFKGTAIPLEVCTGP